MKRLILFCLAITLMLFSAYGQEFYTSFEVSGEQGIPDEVFVSGKECDDSKCSQTTQRDVELFSGGAKSCLEDGLAGKLTPDEFNSCMNTHTIEDSITSVEQTDFVITKFDVPSDFGYLTYFSASNDQYLPFHVEQENFNCQNDICIDDAEFPIAFEKKDGAIAEIGQVNIKNTEDDSKPIQIEVPVEIEQTVCSAYTRSLDNAWEPSVPNGFSDFRAETTVDLEIRSNDNQNLLHSDKVSLPIEADECADFAAFDWTPDENLENESVTISITTDVVDNQVINAQKDYAEVEETVYPENLDNTCWARIEDYTLTNNPDEELTSSLAQISEGETLYATLNSGAYRDESITPSPYTIELSVNGITLYSQSKTTPSSGLNEDQINLTQAISGLSPGDYEVTATSTPNDNNCELVEPVTHTQQLTIQENMKYDLDVVVKNQTDNRIENADVEVELLEAKEDFADNKEFLETQKTTQNGTTTFEELIAGEYQYSINKSGYAEKVNQITIGSDTTLHVTLNRQNKPPVISLPQDLNSEVGEEVEIDLRDYVEDPNEDFSELTITSQKLSGQGEVEIDNGILMINSSTQGITQVGVEVEDSYNLTSNDTTQVNFTEENKPVINEFSATPESGETPLTTTFTIDTFDADGDQLQCTLDYDDSTTITRNCSDISTINHTYTNEGTYKPTLTVSDSQFSVEEELDIVVFTRNDTNTAPVINEFSATPSSGEEPLTTTFTIDTFDADGDQLQCSLDFGDSVQTTQNCSSIDTINHTYTNKGNYTAELEVTDSQTQTTSQTTITVSELSNQPPQISIPNRFNSTVGDEITIDLRNFITDDNDNFSALSITTNKIFGAGSLNLNNGIITVNSSTEGLVGISIIVQDSQGLTSSDMTQVYFKKGEEPVINEFSATPTTGEIPFTTQFRIDADDPDSTTLQCTLDFDDSTTITRNCNNITTINHTYTSTGTFKPNLEVSDSSSTIFRQIQIEALRASQPQNSTPLEQNEVEMSIDKTISPGEFTFGVEITNETLQRRELSFKPTIMCGDVKNSLTTDDKTIPSRAISKNTREDGFIYSFSIDTQDFKNTIPKNQNCNFNVEITDGVSTTVNKSSSVTFSYPEEETPTESIRGEVTDISSYMDIILQDTTTGYNSHSFRLINNDEESKDISISLTSRELGISNSVEYGLNPDSQREVSLSYFVDENKKGSYPVRVSINDGENHQTRYSYITISE